MNKQWFKKRLYRVISVLICLSFLFGSISMVAYGTESEDTYEISLETFYEELDIMLSDGEDYNSEIKIESVENGETVVEDKLSTNRLIVSTDSNSELSKNYGAIAKIEGYNNWHIFQYSSYEDATLAYEAFSQSEGINYVEFDEVIEVADTEVEPANSGKKEPLSWGAEYVESVTANEAIASSGIVLPEVVVAVIDSGIDSTHTFFYSDESNPRILRGNRNNDNVSYDEHGTHVAGIIVDNTLSNVKIKPYNFFYYQGRKVNGTSITLATEIRSAIDDGVDVINMSLGGWTFLVKSDTIVNEISAAIENNIPIVVAAGNELTSASLVFPANDPNVITVAAVSEDGQPAYFSNYGDCVDIAAPGVAVNSTLPGNAESDSNYGELDGTSMAAPFVTAAVAMMKSLYPDLTALEVKEKLVQSVEVPKRWTGLYGKGILNFENIIKSDRLPAPTINLSKEGATISCSTRGAKIYYTTDGTTPVIGESQVYNSEIINTKNIQHIKAIAYKDGELPSYMTTKSMKFSVDDVKVIYKGVTELPYASDSKIVRCYSQNSDIATVSQDGDITGVSVGEATILVQFENNQVGTYKVKVEYDWWQWLIRIFLLGFLWY